MPHRDEPDNAIPAAPTRISPSALERRVKRWLRSGPYDCFIQTAPGLEETLAGELLAGGFVTSADELASTRGGIGLGLDHTGIMRANLELRTAGRVLLRLDNFLASSPEMLYDHARRIPWELHLGTSSTYRLNVSARDSRLQAGDAVQKTIQTAIGRHMRELGLHPKPDDDATLEFHFRFQDDRCTVSLNTSGEHLHRRGVRRYVHEAPVRETIAAGLVLEAYKSHDVIFDPFCGSGTMLIEATDLIAGLAPGRNRKFAFEDAGWHRPGRWREVQRRSAALSKAEGMPRMIGTDLSEEAVAAARHNLGAPEYAHVELGRADALSLDLDGPAATRGLILSNLPYGVRLGDREGAAALLRGFLDRIAGSASSWDLAFLTTHADVISADDRFMVDFVRGIESGGLRISSVIARKSPPTISDGTQEDGY